LDVQAVDIVGDVGERDLRLGAGDADGPEEQPHLILLKAKYVLDEGADSGAFGVDTGRARGHRLAAELLAMDATDPIVDFDHVSLA
jgi:hypothetical protein